MCLKAIPLVITSVFILFVSGCTSMRYVSRGEVSELKEKKMARVTMVDGSVSEMMISGIQDSVLVGNTLNGDAVQININEIDAIEVEETNVGPQHPDDLTRLTFDRESLAQSARVAPKPRLPVVVAQNDCE